jgi:threonine aldolase
MNFASDNIVGASAPVLQAIMEANAGAMAAYGNDEISKRVKERFTEIFEREVSVFFATTGTAANALALSSAVPPYGLCVCHREAHIIDDECGAPEFFMHGAKLAGLPGVGAKLKADDVAAYLNSLPRAVKQMLPKALSISQVSEGGLVYGPDELAALGQVCREHGLSFHMDGARFANAQVALGCTPAEMTWKQGVDILSFGATKNGGLMAEAIVVFKPELAEALDYRSKRAGQIISKGRLIAAQFEGYFADDHWLANARHANRMAKLLSEGLMQLPGVRLAWPTDANEVFPIIPQALDRALKAAAREEDVRKLLEIASSGVERQAAE